MEGSLESVSFNGDAGICGHFCMNIFVLTISSSILFDSGRTIFEESL